MIYLDNAATTRTAPEVVEAMLPYFTEYYGNAGSIYGLAGESRKALLRARETIAGTLGAEANEIYFTAGGSESDNWALKAVFEAWQDKGRHIITSRIEHHAVLHTCEYLEKMGARVTYLDVDSEGLVDPGQLERAIRPDTILISVMTANNEVGTIQPVKEIGEIAAAHGILFHTDAVQAYGHLPLAVQECHIDLLSASAHKFNGPKGAGFLYVGKKAGIRSFIHGGRQERGRRAGTENVPGIVGMAAAARRAHEHMEEREQKERMLRDYLIGRIEAEIPDVALNGHRTRRLPNNVNFSFADMEGETMLIMLDMAQICASAGSACTSGAMDPSHVLLAMGLSGERARGSLRLTLSEENTREELDTVVEELARIVARVRGMMVR
ncbi:MAG: cysteine desulfurase NifS [Lachnospiraceae bacterium]|nr:cysteine desulfurase NifS [Lachnospiraceae bacterium]